MVGKTKAKMAAAVTARWGGGVEDIRKGPWTEQEDVQLVWFVRLFGERRWDFLAKVSGLKRTGKSCRLRWVNYLHPSLKRGRLTPNEERLVLELHSQWGSRWSRIARKLPGRTDNEIKNYWRTHMRRKAQEEKRATAASSASSSSSPSSSSMSCSPSSSSSMSMSCSPSTVTELQESKEEEITATAASQQQQEYYSMDQLWNDVAVAEAAAESYVESWSSTHIAAEPTAMASPAWEFFSESLWRIDDEEYYKKMLDAS